MTKTAKRTELKAKINRAQERQAERGGFSPARAVTDYTKDNPWAALAGGAALGALIGVALPASRAKAGAPSKANGKVKQAGKAAIDAGLSLVESTGRVRKQRREESGASGASLLDDLIIMATSEIANIVRRRM